MERFANVNEHDAKVLMEIEEIVGERFEEIDAFLGLKMHYKVQNSYVTAIGFTDVPVFIEETTDSLLKLIALNKIAIDNYLVFSNNKIEESFFIKIEKIKRLTHLQLSGLNIKNINALSNLLNLQYLNLKNNNISDINFLSSLSNIQALSFAGNNISDISPLSSLLNLQELNLGNNQISDINPIANLVNLQQLRLSNNRILDISAITNLTNLQQLYLDNNQISDINPLSSLLNLQKLNLSNNKISNIAPLSNPIDLREVHLTSNQISDISPLSSLLNLQQLSLNSNQISDISAIANLTNLQQLYLDNNQISNISAIANLSNLQQLRLGYNQISDISAIANLSNLQQLHLYSNQISDISAIANLSNLQQLHLYSNQISDIFAIANLSNLEQLDLGYNKIFDINPIANLSNLQVLDLEYNQIQSIPQAVYKNLQHTNFIYGNNPITSPPLDVLKQGYEGVINYYEQIKQQGKIHLNECKLLILGDAGVGKTSLSKKIINKDAPLPSKEEYTKGADVTTYQFSYTSDGKELNYKAHIWDFGGQTIYYNLHRYFMTDKSLYILVLDSNDTGTHFTEWLWTQKNYGSNSPLLVVSNYKRGNENAPNLNRYVPAFPNIQTPMYHVNLKNIESPQENQRYKNILETIQLKIKQLPIISESVPSLWGKIRESLEEIKKSKNYISREKFDEICEEHHLTNAEDINTMLGYFHNIGVVLCYLKKRNIRGIIVLNMKWILDTTYSILNDNTIATTQAGKFSDEDFERILEANGDDVRLISNLMEEFNIIYKHEQGYYITPALLPDNNDCVTQFDAYRFDKEIHQQFIYEFAMPVPVGLFHQLIVNLHDYIYNELVSRYEVILFKQNTFVLITESPTNNTIKIELKSTDIEDLKGFQAVIMEKIDVLTKRFNNLFVCKIPCICANCKKSKTPHFYDYNREILRYQNRKIDVIRCLESLNEVSIQELYGYLVTKPVVYCMFGNPDKDLHYLQAEYKYIGDALKRLEHNNKLCLYQEFFTNKQTLINDLERLGNQIQILHFGGHADGDGLYLDYMKIRAEGLQLLAKRLLPRLKLVVLNGCATQAQVYGFIQAGVPIVIATAQKINDKLAAEFASYFYKHLANGNTIQSAFEYAINDIKLESSISSELYRNVRQIQSFEAWHNSDINEIWGLFYQPSDQYTSDPRHYKLVDLPNP